MRFRADLASKTYTLSADQQAGLKPEEISKALEVGAEHLQKAAKWTVAVKAKSHPRGLLAKSIVYTKPTSGPLYSKTNLGWKKTPIKASVRGTSAGRRRMVSTVDDYARILEYSSTRQLRHMEESFEENEAAAIEEMEAVLDAAVERAVEDAGL